MAPLALPALLQGASWGSILGALLFVWLFWRLNVVGSFYTRAYDKQ